MPLVLHSTNMQYKWGTRNVPSKGNTVELLSISSIGGTIGCVCHDAVHVSQSITDSAAINMQQEDLI
jgi:hypothetical protein